MPPWCCYWCHAPERGAADQQIEQLTSVIQWSLGPPARRSYHAVEANSGSACQHESDGQHLWRKPHAWHFLAIQRGWGDASTSRKALIWAITSNRRSSSAA